MSTVETDSLYKRVRNLTTSQRLPGFSKVVVKVDASTSYSAGDDSGRTLTVENPYGTQDVANAILEQIRGYSYQPYEATDAATNPATELGDGISVSGIYSGLFSQQIKFGRLMTSHIKAPSDEEIEHEYPQARDSKFVTYSGLRNGTTPVNGAGILDDSINGSSLINGTVSGSTLIDGTLNGSTLIDGSVGGSSLIAGTVGASKITPNSLGTPQFLSGVNTSLGYADFSNNVFNSNLYTVAHMHALRGGFATAFTLFGETIVWKTRTVKNSLGQDITIRYLGSSSDG